MSLAAQFSIPKKQVKGWIIWGIPVLIAVGSLMHFIYDWSGKSIIAGIMAPVNESVWEHLKMTFLPVLLWWIAGYILLKKSNKFTASRWFLSCTVSVVVCPLVITSFYYTYTGALGFESLILDIFSMVLGLTSGQLLAFHVFIYTNPKKYWLYFSITILILLAASFAVFTFVPPKIPFFMEH